MRHPELLVPASSLEVLKIAVIFGADAVYIGGEAFGLPGKGKRILQMKRSKRALHLHMSMVSKSILRQIFLAHNQDLEGVKKIFMN